MIRGGDRAGKSGHITHRQQHSTFSILYCSVSHTRETGDDDAPAGLTLQ